MNDHNGQLVALRDAFGQLRQTLITLSCNLDDKSRFKPCPEDEYGTLEDGTRIEFGTSSSPASKHWHAGRLKDAFHASSLAETAAREILMAATPWLPAFAEARGEGTLRDWCNGAARLLAWTMHRRAGHVDEADAERQLEAVGVYWGMMHRLCINAGVDEATGDTQEETPAEQESPLTRPSTNTGPTGKRMASPATSAAAGDATDAETQMIVAIALLHAGHPVTEIAKRLGIRRTKPYEWPKFVAENEKLKREKERHRAKRKGSRDAGNDFSRDEHDD